MQFSGPASSSMPFSFATSVAANLFNEKILEFLRRGKLLSNIAAKSKH